jgi:S1-C subfamily serine protease
MKWLNKQTITAFLIGAILFSGIGVGAATGVLFDVSNDTLYVNGARIDKPLYKLEGSNYLPLRAVAEALDATVDWEPGRIDINKFVWDAEKLDRFSDIPGSVLIITAEDKPDIVLGSGFAVLDGTYILTNQHVVGVLKTVQGKNQLEDKYYDLDVVKADKTKDIAVLKVRGREYPYPALTLGDSDTVKEGDGVISISHAYSQMECDVSSGKVERFTEFNNQSVIESTVMTSPGSSGGILLNEKMEVIGITQAGNLALSDAIQINTAKEILIINN